MNQSETEIEILAEKIARWARARSAEIERDRRLPDELVTRLREAGLLRATMPREVAAPDAGRFAAGSTTRTSCSPAASSTTGKCRRSSR
ncbi:dehydrogenase [Mycobacterium tuberculosis]|nr:dehydrogenase [Mycobacterium tuberculosis]